MDFKYLGSVLIWSFNYRIFICVDVKIIGGCEMYCGRCWKELKDTARFCPNCGTPVPDAINRKVEYAYVQKKTGNRKMLWFWIVVIGFLVVFSVIGIKIYLGEKPENRLEGTWYGCLLDTSRCV